MSLDVRDRRSALAASTADAVPAERAGKKISLVNNVQEVGVQTLTMHFIRQL